MNTDIQLLQQFYNGFYISEPRGNNAFSYTQRQQRRIYVPPIIRGSLADLLAGEEIAFSEVVEDQEINKKGLRSFIYFRKKEKDFFVFDNHNHAFFFWIYAFKYGQLKKGLPLVHVDQHSDMREPEHYLHFSDENDVDLKAAFEYTNYVLNVGNFIKPALAAGFFSTVEIIDSSFAFENNYSEEIVLDIDMDVFSPDKAYIDHDLKMGKIRSYIEAARFITIATSPYFMDQKEAIGVIKELLED